MNKLNDGLTQGRITVVPFTPERIYVVPILSKAGADAEQGNRRLVVGSDILRATATQTHLIWTTIKRFGEEDDDEPLPSTDHQSP